MAMYTRMALLFLVLLSGCNWLDSETPATNLASLSISVGQFEPAFSSSTLEYAATVPADTASITLTLSASHISDTVTVNGASVNSMSGSINVPLDPGANTITIVVSSADQSRTRTYTVVVTRTVLVYSVGGSVSGLAGTLTLQNNGVDNLGIAADGAFVFKTSVIDGGDYQVTVSTQPDGQLCSVTNGAGTIDSADVTDVAVDCVDLFSGLFVDDLVVGLDYTCSSGSVSETASDGQFTCPQSDDISFWLGSNELGPIPVAYAVISPILLFPDDGLAAINLARLLQSLDSDQLPDNGVIVIDESLVAALPIDLDFSLQAAEFEAAVGITLVSLETAVQRLRDAVTQYVPGNAAPIADAGADRNVTVGATVTLSGAGSSDANGDGLTFTWNFVSTPAGSSAGLASRFTISPSFVADVAGSYVVGVLVSDGTVINYDIVVITANDGSALPAAPQGLQAVAGDALVSLSWSPVDGATGYMIYWNTTGNVTTSSNWTGPITSTQANLGSLTNGTTYYYRVAARNASGDGPLSIEASATPQAVQPTTFTVGGTVSGLTGTVTLQNNGADSLAVSANSSFTFATAVINGSTYAVTVSAQPAGQTCGVTNGSGTISGADVSNVSVSCVDDVPASGASLTSLSLSSGVFHQIFQSTLYSYTATVDYLISSTMVTAVADQGATLTVNGIDTASGVASDPIELVEGANTISVTVTSQDGSTNQTYTIVVTRQTAFAFAQQAYVKASNTGAGDDFGYSVALSGDTLAVGALGERSAATGINGDQTDNSLRNAGAVYVFTRDGAGVWSQQAYVKASNTEADDNFGYSVAVSGDTLAVGANYEGSAATGINGNQANNSAAQSGAVYVFTRDGAGIWSQQAYVKASNTNAADVFGSSVALSGDTLAVGAFAEDSAATGINGNQTDNSVRMAGAVYVFTRDGAGVWSQQAYVKASNSGGNWFGYSVALSGDTLAVGASYESTSAGFSGAVYVFTRDGAGAWSQQARVKASNPGISDLFGSSVALSGDTLAVGAIGEDSPATGIDGDQGDAVFGDYFGAVYVYLRNAGGTWSQQAYVKASNAEAEDRFGYSVALSGDTLVVGAPYEKSASTGIDGPQADNSASGSGAVYLFTRDGSGTWSQQAYVKASNSEANDQFGSSVALSGDTLAVGSYEDSAAIGIDGDQADNSETGSGAAYVFK